MAKEHRKLFDFEKKVADTLLEDGPLEFVETTGDDVEKIQDFLRNKIEKLKKLYEESLGLCTRRASLSIPIPFVYKIRQGKQKWCYYNSRLVLSWLKDCRGESYNDAFFSTHMPLCT